MGWKKIGIKAKLGSTKQKMFKVFRLISSLAKEDPKITSTSPVSTTAPYELVKPFPNHFLEAELKKAEALNYWHMFLDRPK